MIREFYANEEEFEAIVAQVEQWPGELLFQTTNIVGSRVLAWEAVDIELLRERLKQLKLNGVQLRRDDNVYSIFMSLHYGDGIKGYVYFSTPPDVGVIDGNLDRFDKRGWRRAYRHIKGNWYLYMTGSESF